LQTKKSKKISALFFNFLFCLPKSILAKNNFRQKWRRDFWVGGKGRRQLDKSQITA